jgi:hypothetical protein
VGVADAAGRGQAEVEVGVDARMRDAVDLAVVLKIRDGADSREAPRAIRRIQ